MGTKEIFAQVTQRRNTKGETYYSFDFFMMGSPIRMRCKWGRWKTIKGAQRAIKNMGYTLLTEEVYVYVK